MKQTLVSAALVALASAASAQDTNITSFIFNGQRLTISQATQISPSKIVQFATLPGQCEGLCASPMVAARGVTTIGEFEVVEFLKYAVEGGSGLVIDARSKELRQAGFIPSSVNIPVSTIASSNPYRTQILEALGGRRTGGGWDFSGGYDLVIYDTGPGTSDASDLVRELVSVGYPAGKLRFYRGGMQTWAGLGLSYAEPLS